jgi:hypothetical protein
VGSVAWQREGNPVFAAKRVGSGSFPAAKWGSPWFFFVSGTLSSLANMIVDASAVNRLATRMQVGRAAMSCWV